MNAKNLVSAAMLLLVAVAVVVLVGREMQEPTPGNTEIAPLPDNALAVYYLHGDTRCPTCRTIEQYSQEAVHNGFAEELAQSKVIWQVINYEQPQNSHFVNDYEVAAPTIVLVRKVDGKVSDWRNLTRVWELVGDHDAFTEYVQNETRSMLQD
jgi:hypothetical protein